MRPRPVVADLVRLLGVGLATGLALAGCGSSDDRAADDRTLHVLAAASLTEAFTRVAQQFEEKHPGTEVRMSFDSSATLAEQVVQGAPADVLATADARTMRTVEEQGGTAGEPRLFATNHLQLVVPRDNPARIAGLVDLAKPGVRYVVCVDSAPCGRLATTVLDAAEVTAKPASEEVDVKAVLGKVQLGEADAGLVYASDAVAAADKVAAIELPMPRENVTSYPVAALRDSEEPALADAFVDLLLSPAGRRVLADAGFGKP